MASLHVVRDVRRRQDKEANHRMITFNKEKDERTFLQRVTKLTPEDFIALAKVLDVKMSDVDKETGEYALRDAEIILNDMLVSFKHYKHKERQIILKAMKK
jgi:hypothetical protein